MLKFDNNWRFYSPGKISMEFRDEISQIILKVSRSNHSIIEHFKQYFASAAGTSSSRSTNISWAVSDLDSFMITASENAPLFIEAFYDACEDLKQSKPETPVPDLSIINNLLANHNSNYQISPPNLVVLAEGQKLELKTELPASLDQNAKTQILESLDEANRLLAEGRNKQAVQEILWLLESITTIYRGVGVTTNTTIQGKYFNKIIGEIRQSNKGNATDQIIGWIATLHGYLSAPAGGGVRHGLDLKEGISMTKNEAVLYCNLTTNYINFLLSEYDRITAK